MTIANSWAAEHFPEGMSLRFAGSAELATATNNEVVIGQMTSFTLSLGIILVVLLVQFRSWSKGLLGLVPLLVTVIFNFGTMGLLGIPLNLGTAVVSSIVIGIGVDFAIHYLSRLQFELDRGLSMNDAFAATMAASGKAITANAVTVSLGFLAMTLSDFMPLQQIGMLIFQTLLVSAVATLVLIPALVAFTPRGV